MHKLLFENQLTVEVSPLRNNTADLESEWRSLELKADPPIFLTWVWIGSWIEIARNDCCINIIKVLHGAEVVGLALLTEEKIIRHKFIPSSVMILNSTKKPVYNMIIEHNGLLIKAGHEDEVAAAVLGFLDRSFPGIDEFVIPFSSRDSVLKANCQNTGFICKTLDQSESPYIDLELIRQEKQSLLDNLSSNTRYQLRKSLKHYSVLGETNVEQAADVDTAILFFEMLKKLHQSSWQQRGYSGSFANETWERFHCNIIRNHFDNNKIQLLRVYAGSVDIGYIYSLVLNGRVNMIQTGFDYTIQSKAKPGYVCHYLAAEFNFIKGMKIYDFLAGDSQYKRSLSNKMSYQENLVLQRRKLKFKIEDLAVWLYREKIKFLAN